MTDDKGRETAEDRWENAAGRAWPRLTQADLEGLRYEAREPEEPGSFQACLSEEGQRILDTGESGEFDGMFGLVAVLEVPRECGCCGAKEPEPCGDDCDTRAAEESVVKAAVGEVGPDAAETRVVRVIMEQGPPPTDRKVLAHDTSAPEGAPHEWAICGWDGSRWCLRWWASGALEALDAEGWARQPYRWFELPGAKPSGPQTCIGGPDVAECWRDAHPGCGGLCLSCACPEPRR